jgi:hypothetical protein
MDLRYKRRALHGVVGGLGCVAALGGFAAGFYPPGVTIFLTFGIWILGAVLVNLFTER